MLMDRRAVGEETYLYTMNPSTTESRSKARPRPRWTGQHLDQSSGMEFFGRIGLDGLGNQAMAPDLDHSILEDSPMAKPTQPAPSRAQAV